GKRNSTRARTRGRIDRVWARWWLREMTALMLHRREEERQVRCGGRFWCGCWTRRRRTITSKMTTELDAQGLRGAEGPPGCGACEGGEGRGAAEPATGGRACSPTEWSSTIRALSHSEFVLLLTAFSSTAGI
ncbi:unnamed protein product, partial [Prorocentrum cordatum]